MLLRESFQKSSLDGLNLLKQIEFIPLKWSKDLYTLSSDFNGGQWNPPLKTICGGSRGTFNLSLGVVMKGESLSTPGLLQINFYLIVISLRSFTRMDDQKQASFKNYSAYIHHHFKPLCLIMCQHFLRF